MCHQGGKRNGKENIAATACRELDEETGRIIGADVIERLKLALNQSFAHQSIAAAETGEGGNEAEAEAVQIKWLPSSKYALCCVSVDAVEGLRNATSDASDTFAAFLESPKAKTAAATLREMAALEWVKLSALAKCTDRWSKFANVVFSDSALDVLGCVLRVSVLHL